MAANRLAYIDWMRGLACVLMFQTHCYDAWLGPEARQGEFLKWSQLLGTFPAPLFLFLAGVSFALVTGRLRAKGFPAGQIARTTTRRGAEIFALGLLFRVQEFVLGYPWAPWTDLLRVDILNMIGVAMMLMGAVCRVTRTRTSSITGAAGVALLIALVTPPVWTTWRGVTSRLPWWLESYLNGAHIFPEPQAWLFPIFPWTAFAFAGLAVGFVLFGGKEQAKSKDDAETLRTPRGAEAPFASQSAAQGKQRNTEKQSQESWRVTLLCSGGLAMAGVAWWLDSLPGQVYAVYDFWHTSPNFFLIRLGLLLVILAGCYGWCALWERRGGPGFSPMAQLGTTSLLVYWVHIQFVYGRFSILEKNGQTVAGASLGLLIIFLGMLALSVLRTKLKGRLKLASLFSR
jgi:uncharacterized membrane protein